MNMFTHKTGTLLTGSTRSGGKVIDEWRFKSAFTNAFLKSVPAPKLAVQVSIEKSDEKGITFCAHGDGMRAPIRDTDINQLKEKVEAELTFQHDMLTGVTWEDWLQVEVSGGNRHNSHWKRREALLNITYTHLKRGVDPKTGEAYTINSNGIAIAFPAPKKAGELDAGETESEWIGLNQRDKTIEYSYVPATPENIAALEDVMSRMDALREKLAEFLRDDVIQHSLANLNDRFPALPFSTSTKDQP